MNQLSPLHFASITNNPQMIKHILLETENPNSTDDCGVKYIFYYYQIIYEFNNFNNIYQLTALMYACIHGHIDVIDALLEDERIEVYGFEVCYSKTLFLFCKFNFYQRSVLNLACISGNVEIVKRILQYKEIEDNINEKVGNDVSI